MSPRAATVNDQQGEFFLLPLSDPARPMRGKMHRFPTPSEKRAALAVLPRTGTQRMVVLQYVAEAGWHGITAGEIEEHSRLTDEKPLRRSSICGRLDDLVEGGWIRKNGEARLAPNTGFPNDVYVLTRRGQEEVPRIT